MSFNPWRNITPERHKELLAKGVATRLANKQKQEETKRKEVQHFCGIQSEIQKLESRLSSLRKMEEIQVLSCVLTNKSLITANEIVKASLPWKNLSGIYFLISGDEVVYVGQSVNIYSRIQEHSKLKQFERYAYIHCSVEMLDKLESLYIHFLQPKLNGNINSSDGKIKNAPISLNELIGLKECA